jgi:uncharacterized protein (DUF1499 family)
VERLWLVPTYVILTFVAVGPLAAHFHLLPPLAGFGLLLLAVLVGVTFGIGLAGAAAFASVTNKPWRPRAVRGAIVPLLVGVPLLALASRSGPAIHDLSTDLTDRLEFTQEVRDASPNKDPEGAQRAMVEDQQRESYPDLAPALLSLPPGEAFTRAKKVAEDMPGWQVTHADTETGRIEAIATSSFFHFQDDVVIRVKANGDGSRIDMRSRSRVGQGDLGANAKRIHAFMTALSKAS